MKDFKRKTSNLVNSIFMCVFQIIVGVLLLVNPNAFTSGIIMVCGAICLFVGIINVIQYFFMDAVTAAESQKLFKGLLLAAAGAFCSFNSEWFLVTFPVLSILYGIGILLLGLSKVQWAFDMLRQKKAKWFLAVISAAITLICAVVILKNPFATTQVLWMFTGISLIVEAVLDITAVAMNGLHKSSEPEAKQITEIVDAE